MIWINYDVVIKFNQVDLLNISMLSVPSWMGNEGNWNWNKSYSKMHLYQHWCILDSGFWCMLVFRSWVWINEWSGGFGEQLQSIVDAMSLWNLRSELRDQERFMAGSLVLQLNGTCYGYNIEYRVKFLNQITQWGICDTRKYWGSKIESISHLSLRKQDIEIFYWLLDCLQYTANYQYLMITVTAILVHI